jgi:outer membrane protein assembly factor BamB
LKELKGEMRETAKVALVFLIATLLISVISRFEVGLCIGEGLGGLRVVVRSGSHSFYSTGCRFNRGASWLLFDFNPDIDLAPEEQTSRTSSVDDDIDSLWGDPTYFDMSYELDAVPKYIEIGPDPPFELDEWYTLPDSDAELLVTLVMGAYMGAPSNWWMYRHDKKHTGFSSEITTQPDTVVWSYQTGGDVVSSPAVAYGKVFVGSDDGNVYALNENDGSPLWSFPTGGRVRSSPLVVDETVYIGSEDGKVYALSQFDGTELWSYQTGGWIYSSPVLVARGGTGGDPQPNDRTLLVGSDDGYLYAIEPVTHSLKWRKSYGAGYPVRSSPAVWRERIYVGWAGTTGNVGLYCLDLSDGSILWYQATVDWVDSSPAVVNGRVFVIDHTGTVMAYDATNGNPQWDYDTHKLSTYSSPAVAYGMVFACAGTSVFALNEVTGTKIWERKIGAPTYESSPAVSNSMVFVGSADGNAFVLDAYTGTILWQYLTGDGVSSSPAVVNGKVIFGSRDDKIYALGTSAPPPPPPPSSGPEIDVLRFSVIRSPTAQVLAMLTDAVDVLPSLSVPMDVYSSLLAEANGGLIRTADVDNLNSEGFFITQDLGFHVGYIAYNIRDTATIQSYYRPGISYWPFHDVEFRHALVHCYDQLAIIPPIYGYIVTPVRSLVPPAQSKYYNSAVPAHPYNPGDPFTSPAGEHSSCGILKAAGYAFVDADSSGTVTDADYWKMPNGDPLDEYVIWTPLAADAPTSFQHGAAFVADLAEIGLASTTANGNHGLANEGRYLNDYMNDVYGTSSAPGGRFDAFMVFNNFGRLPEQLYLLLHSSQDTYMYWGRRNAPGVNDVAIDTLAETAKFNLDTDAIEVAAKQIQEMLYDPTLLNADNFALSYMLLYSRSYFSAFDQNLRGIVKSSGWGANNKWTFLNINWEPGTERLEDADGDGLPETVVIWTLGNAPDSLNPLYTFTKYDWEIVARVYDGLTNVNPYNHRDIEWIASDWTITQTELGMEIDFTLRDDVYWQDGYQFTAYDIEFCLEFIRDHDVPKYANPCEALVDVIVTDATHCTIVADEASINLFYEFAGLAAMLPPQIWDRTWPSNQAVLEYHPEQHAYGSDMAPGYAPGPWATNVSTNLFGTGPWIFQFYDEVSENCDLWANRNYFMTIDGVHDLKTEMFWEVGDYNRDGIINVVDLVFVSFAFGSFQGEPGYDPDADFNSDGIIDIRDITNCAFHLLWQREYP